MHDVLKKLIREPLFHFVILGFCIFALYTWLARGKSESGNIVITKGDITSLETGFFNTWHRPPSEEERQGLISDRVKQEVYDREAVALGLDKDDLIIQRRLQQKMEFIMNDNLDESKPTDEQLQEYLQKHPDHFKIEPLFSFRQVYFDPAKHENFTTGEAPKILVALKEGKADPKKTGNITLLPAELSDVRINEISNQFGKEFADEILKLSPGEWQGPVKSTYGLHLVLLTDRKEGSAPVLAEVREAVQREWEDERRKEANEKFYQELLKNYTVTIEDHQG